MDGVVGLPQIVCRLLDAGELRLVGDYHLASPDCLFSEGAMCVGEAGESIFQNSLDVGVVFPRRTPRVEIHDVRMLWVQNYEGAVFVFAQNNSNRPSSSN